MSSLQAAMDANGIKSAATLNEIWEDLRLGIESVYQQQTMSKKRYMLLYT